MTAKRICISVDVEEDLPGVVPRGSRGLDIGLPNLLRCFEAARIRADFFFLSSIVQAYPDVVQEVAESGHGIGNHGLNHMFLCAKSPALQRMEILDSTRTLEEVVPQEPRMFRAAGFSTDAVTLKILQEAGYVIDSSTLPGRFVRRLGVFSVYDHRGAPREPHFPLPPGNGPGRPRLLEIPVTENPLRPGAPLGLGAVNAYGPTRMIAALKAAEVSTLVFLIHPWELIDIETYYSGLPEGYARACSGDLTALQEFLAAARGVGTFSSLAEVRKDLIGG